MCMYMYMYMYMYLCVCISLSLYIYIYIYACITIATFHLHQSAASRGAPPRAAALRRTRSYIRKAIGRQGTGSLVRNSYVSTPCVYIYIYIYTHTHVYTSYLYIHLSLSIYIYIYIYLYACIAISLSHALSSYALTCALLENLQASVNADRPRPAHCFPFYELRYSYPCPEKFYTCSTVPICLDMFYKLAWAWAWVWMAQLILDPHTGVCETSTPPGRKTLWKMGFQSTKSGA